MPAPSVRQAIPPRREDADRILQKDPDNGDALLIRADATLARGDPATAIVDYQRVVRDYPQWEEGYIALARAYRAADKADGVRRTFESGRQALPQSLPLARAYAQTGGGDCRDEAAEGLKRSRARFGLDVAPGTPPPIALVGRLN